MQSVYKKTDTSAHKNVVIGFIIIVLFYLFYWTVPALLMLTTENVLVIQWLRLLTSNC